jgi:hypothetical protein
VRGEYQHAPGAAGYSQALSQQVSLLDEIVGMFAPPNDPQATIPTGRLRDRRTRFGWWRRRFPIHLLGHEISLRQVGCVAGAGDGRRDGWSNNAENIYSFRINRVEPMHIKYLSKWLGPVRYDFFYGSLKGHTDPNDDWVHSEMFSVPADARTSSSASSGR